MPLFCSKKATTKGADFFSSFINFEMDDKELNAWVERWDVGQTNWKYEEQNAQHEKNYEVLKSELKLSGTESILIPLCGDA